MFVSAVFSVFLATQLSFSCEWRGESIHDHLRSLLISASRLSSLLVSPSGPEESRGDKSAGRYCSARGEIFSIDGLIYDQVTMGNMLTIMVTAEIIDHV